jgi:phosphonate C-P lyase system protein PhnK
VSDRVAPTLELHGVTVRYGAGCEQCAASGDVRCPRCGTVYGAREVSLDVFPGETLGIVGESGSGKSTVVACAALDCDATLGEVRLSGRSVRGLRGAERRAVRAESIGIVYQTPQQGLDFALTAGGNVADRLLGSGWRAYGRVRERALRYHGGMELPVNRFDVPVREYSGGMQQRVQLAKALATAPPLLLLDEPTSGLDVSVQARMLDLIRRLHIERRFALVVVSHDLAVIRMLADRLIVMRDGRIVERGVTDQVLGDPQHPYTQLLVSAQLGT